MPKSLAQLAFDHSLRAETILHLGAMCSTYAVSDITTEAFQDDWEEIWDVLALPYPETEEDIAEHLADNGRNAFLIRIGTPVPISFTAEGDFMFSWSHYRMKWFYGETVEQVFEQAAQWQEHYIEEKRAEAQSKEAANV